MKLVVELTREEAMRAIDNYLQTYHGVTIDDGEPGFGFETMTFRCKKYFPPNDVDAWGR